MLEDIIRVEINHCARLPAPRSVTISQLIDEEALQTQIRVRSQHLSDPKLSKYWWKLNRRYCSRGSGRQITFLPWRNMHGGVCQEKLNSFVSWVRLLYGGWGMIFYWGKHVSRNIMKNLPSPPPRPHLGQHSPAGANRLCPAGQLRGGQGRGPQATLPLEQMHSVQGEGLHWLSCCRDGRRRKDEEEEEKFAKPQWQKSNLEIYKGRKRKKASFCPSVMKCFMSRVQVNTNGKSPLWRLNWTDGVHTSTGFCTREFTFWVWMRHQRHPRQRWCWCAAGSLTEASSCKPKPMPPYACMKGPFSQRFHGKSLCTNTYGCFWVFSAFGGYVFKE